MISKPRVIFVFLFLFTFWVGILFRAALIQVVPNKKLANIQAKQFNKTVKINARRGAIYDRNKNELAATVTSYSVYADPSLIKEKRKAARSLAKTLNIPYRKVFGKIKSKKRRFAWIKRRVNLATKKKIKKLKIRGIGLLEEPKRIYPNGHLLAQTLGFVGVDDQGLEGLEKKLDTKLKGEVQRLNFNRDAWGRPLLLNSQYFTSHKDGQGQILTIDSELQFKLEDELQKAVERFQADSAVGVIMDVDSFEVLSLASVPTYNPHAPFDVSSMTRRNRGITDAFEPGSTMKTFIVAGAISSRLIKPTTKFNCENGKFKVGKRYIREADSDHHFGVLTVEEILANSSNIGTSKIALKMGTKKVKKVLKEFGFGSKTDIDFPGESKGIVRKGSWPRHTLATVSFGHGVSTTPIQMASAYASIANGGVLKQPILVKGTVDSVTGRVSERKTKVVRRVLSKEDATTMRLMLMSATGEDYSGFNARIHGFPVAGKTGTAQKVSPRGGYSKGEYIASFAGFVPAHDPKFVIYIAVDNPKLKYYGSQVAAPVFSKVASYAVLKAGFPPVLLSKNDIIDPKVLAIKSQKKTVGTKVGSSRRLEKMPLLNGLSLREVYQKISGQDLQIKIKGSGRVVRTWPGPGDKFSKSRKVKIQLKQAL